MLLFLIALFFCQGVVCVCVCVCVCVYVCVGVDQTASVAKFRRNIDSQVDHLAEAVVFGLSVNKMGDRVSQVALGHTEPNCNCLYAWLRVL